VSDQPTSDPEIPTIEITRVFDAPLALVWMVWTEPEHVKQWWGPHGFSTPVYEADLRTGGTMRYHMRAPDGTVFPSGGRFEEVVPHERIVVTGTVEIAGNVAFTARTDVRFSEANGRTTLAIRQTYTNVTPIGRQAIEGASEGWAQQFERFEAHLRAQGAR
jgi:uncharacterized protein YndB with AHSA1/START domain